VTGAASKRTFDMLAEMSGQLVWWRPGTATGRVTARRSSVTDRSQAAPLEVLLTAYLTA
jgi:hypothetical protein